jgi:murein DD-endopeptidase MepM/ murein hydrolase activator NlpD
MNRASAYIISLLALTLLGSACATPRAVHPGRKGFFARLKEMDRKNRSGSGRQASGKVRSENIKSGDSGAVASTKKSASMRRLSQVTSKWRWPLADVRVTSDFGVRGGNHHEGVDLKASSGTPVYASGPGVVLYAGNRISGYGNMVIIGHDQDLSTVYAHNSRLYVKKGQTIKAGTRIALSGNSGKSSGPHLHFEIRSGVVALDPLKVMPSRSGVAASSHRTRGLASADLSHPR